MYRSPHEIDLLETQLQRLYKEGKDKELKPLQGFKMGKRILPKIESSATACDNVINDKDRVLETQFKVFFTALKTVCLKPRIVRSRGELMEEFPFFASANVPAHVESLIKRA